MVSFLVPFQMTSEIVPRTPLHLSIVSGPDPQFWLIPEMLSVEGIGPKLFLPYTEAMSFQVQVNLSPKILFEKPVVSETIQRI